MPLRLTFRTPSGNPQATVTLPDNAAPTQAIDVIISLADPVSELVQRGWLPPEGLTAMGDLQRLLFDRDAQGPFIRDGVDLQIPVGAFTPDLPLQGVLQAGPDGVPALTITIVSPATAAPAPVAPAQTAGGTEAAAAISQAEQVETYKTLFVLFKLAEGALIDVTKDDPYLMEPLRRLEKAKEIDINVDKAAWQLSAAGKAHHDQLKQQARQLIARFDIFGDVDDAGSTPRFGTGTGDDWRVAAYELAGTDPFYARFLLGLNDGEWRSLPDWTSTIDSSAWYDTVFAPILAAPGIDDIGRTRLQEAVRHGSDLVHETLEEERSAGINPQRDETANPYRDGTLT
ncbi:MAG: hypothetical protein H7338_12485 [Candidatus Sericytochromatia bacterium]|nr:hypothetical protein [Candidatus Sericytochromatia bacterium]